VKDAARPARHDVAATSRRVRRLERQVARIGDAEQAQLVVRHLLAVRAPDRSERNGLAHQPTSPAPTAVRGAEPSITLPSRMLTLVITSSIVVVLREDATPPMAAARVR
jgi:hypothetical protein